MEITQFTAKIRHLCRKKKIAIKDMLSACDINRNALYDMDKNNNYPSVDRVARIADCLDVSVDYLLGRTDTPTLTPPADVDTSTADVAALLAIYNRLSPVDRAKLLVYADNLSHNGSKDGGD